MEPLTPADIARIRSDEALQARLGEEITRLIGGSPASTRIGPFVRSLRSLPRGLRAMAATYELDVSMALDALEDHFVNWHHKALAQETLRGLRVLGAREEAMVFEQAFGLASRHWRRLGTGVPDLDSALYRKFEPLNARLWRLLGYQGHTGRSLLTRWAPYARAHPDEVCVMPT